MSSSELMVGDKPLSSLRVVDLKEELEKRGLSKSGSKKDLYERLKGVLNTEKARQAVPTDDEQLPNISIQQKLADQNPFLRDYFTSQAELFHEQKRVQKLYQEEKKRESEASADEGGSSPAKSGGASPLKSPSQSPSKRVVDHQSPARMTLESESPVKGGQESPQKEIAAPEKLIIGRKSPQKPSDTVIEQMPTLQKEESPSPVKTLPVSEPEPVVVPVVPEKKTPVKRAPDSEPEPVVVPPPERLTRKSSRSKEPEAVAVAVTLELVKEVASPKKTADMNKSQEKLVEEEEASKAKPSVVEEPKPVIKEPSPRRRSSREIVAKSEEAIPTETISIDESVNRVRTRRGSQQTRFGPLVNNTNKVSLPDASTNRIPENNLVEKVISEEKPETKLADEVQVQPQPQQEPRKKRGGREIIFDIKKEQPKPAKEDDTKNDVEEKPAESKRIPLRTRAERFKKEISPPPAITEAKDDKDETTSKPIPVSTELPRKMSASSSSDEVSAKPTPGAASSRPRRGGREIIFDIKKEEVKPTGPTPTAPTATTPATPTAPLPPVAKRSVALLSTEELASDEILDFGDDEKDKREDTPIEREPWTPRKINVKSKAAPPGNQEQDISWSNFKREGKDGEEIITFNPTWQIVKETHYPDLELINDEDLKLDVHDASLDDVNFGRQFDDIQITRTISNEFAENGNGHDVEEQTEEVKTRKRMISEIIEDEERELSPSRNPPSEVIKITNLVRPFTLTQLRELLQRTGNVIDLWVDKIKSKCVVKYELEAHALETRAALHGIAWPPSNAKYLRVDFSTVEELDELRNKELSDERPKLEESTEQTPTSATVRAWDVGKDGRSRRRSRSLSRDKELDDRKRARRSSRSPHDERGSRRVRDHRSDHASERDKKEPAKTGKALDELFRKTVATPCIYWLPLTPQQIAEKEELRRQRMLERDRRISEMAQQREQHRYR